MQCSRVEGHTSAAEIMLSLTGTGPVPVHLRIATDDACLVVVRQEHVFFPFFLPD